MTWWYYACVPGGQEKTSEGRLARLQRYVIYFFLFLAWASLIFFITGGRSDPSWLHNWDRWDAHWYEQIWLHGYHAADPRTLVFPPGYPFIIGILSRLFSSSFIGAAIPVNLIVFLAAATMISEWLSRKFNVCPYLVFVFVLSAPASYFVFTAYSDILFMLLLWVLLCLALATPQPGRKSLLAQSILLFVLPWIRITGYALASWVLDRKVAAVAVFGSLGLWLALNRMITGHPFYFLHAQEIFAMPSGNLFQGLFSCLERLFSGDLSNGHLILWLEFAFLPLFYFGALISSSVWLAKKGEGLLAITVLSILILSHNQSVWRSAVRYDLPLLPVLCLPLLAKSGSRANSHFFKAAFYILLGGQFVLQFLFARLFHSGGWAF